jgi:hypothetical protein
MLGGTVYFDLHIQFGCAKISSSLFKMYCSIVAAYFEVLIWCQIGLASDMLELFSSWIGNLLFV